MRDNAKSAYHRKAALVEVICARDLQEEYKRLGRFQFTCADCELTNAQKLVILTEELGEVARQVKSLELHGKDRTTEEQDRYKLRVELTQVAAVSLAWIEGILKEERKYETGTA